MNHPDIFCDEPDWDEWEEWIEEYFEDIPSDEDPVIAVKTLLISVFNEIFDQKIEWSSPMGDIFFYALTALKEHKA